MRLDASMRPSGTRRVGSIGFRGPPALVVIHIFTPPAFPLPSGLCSKAHFFDSSETPQNESGHAETTRRLVLLQRFMRF